MEVIVSEFSIRVWSVKEGVSPTLSNREFQNFDYRGPEPYVDQSSAIKIQTSGCYWPFNDFFSVLFCFLAVGGGGGGVV